MGKQVQINYEELDKKANLGAFSTMDMEVLVPEVQAIPADGTYVEVGVDRGKSLSIARMVAKKGVHVYGVDLREDPKVDNTTFIRGNSPQVGADWKSNHKIDVLFIDGDHSYFGCRADIQSWFPHLKEGGVMLFHDCDESSPGVIQAVSEFVSTHQVSEFKLFKRLDKNTSMALVRL